MRIMEGQKSFFKSPQLITTLIVIISVLAAFYYHGQYQKAREDLKKATPNQLLGNEESARQAAKAVAARENQALIAKVGSLIVLPDEEPSIATVVDKTKLADQPFFEKSENGDKLLIFTQARKAILYRVSANKIINVAVINIVGQQNAASPSAQVQKIRVAILNGTKTAGLTKSVETKLKKIAGVEIGAKDWAIIQVYPKTLVIDLTGALPDRASLIAQSLGGEVSLLPKEEHKPNADLVVIIGADYKAK